MLRMSSTHPTSPRHLSPQPTRWVWGVVAASALALSACSVEVQNRQAAQEVAQMAQPSGSVYKGWRIFQNKCVQCHGPAAQGTALGPDLLPRLSDMGPRRFVGVVLNRYDWTRPAEQASNDAQAMDKLIDKILQSQDAVVTMPAWQQEPVVNAHIMDLYAYLSARANGSQGTGRPTP